MNPDRAVTEQLPNVLAVSHGEQRNRHVGAVLVERVGCDERRVRGGNTRLAGTRAGDENERRGDGAQRAAESLGHRQETSGGLVLEALAHSESLS